MRTTHFVATTRAIAVGSISAGAVFLAIAPTYAQQYTMRIGMVTINDQQHTFAKKYGEELSKRTKGAIKVDVFPAGQLGKIPRQIENLKIGAQGAFHTPPGFFSGINRAFEVPDAPGIYKSYWHAQNAFTDPEFRKLFLALAEGSGIIGAALYNYGATSIASIAPIHKLEDMKGLKVRVLASKMESRLAAELGMTGVPMPYTEVLPALQQRTIDGVRSAISAMASSKFYTVAKTVTVIESGTIPTGLWISKPWLQKLPKNLQDEVLKTAHDLEGWGGKNAFAFNQRAEKLWTDNGGEVIRLSAADQAEVIKRLAPLGDEFLGKDPATKDVYAALKKALAKASSEEPK